MLPPHLVIKFFIVTSKTLNYLLSVLDTYLSQGQDIKPLNPVRTVTVFVMENLRKSGLVPCEPDVPILIEDDDEAPICIGAEEGEAQRRKAWESKRPHRVYVPTSTYRTVTEQDGRGVLGASGKVMKNVESSIEEGVYTSVHAALSESFAIASGRPTLASCPSHLDVKEGQMASSTPTGKYLRSLCLIYSVCFYSSSSSLSSSPSSSSSQFCFLIYTS